MEFENIYLHSDEESKESIEESRELLETMDQATSGPTPIMSLKNL
jgi:hypothetical protein